MYYALATSDEYVWCYSERMNWWQDNVPDGAEAAIRSARKKIADGQEQGHAASSAAAMFQDGVYTLLFSRATDATSGIRPRISHTATPESGWSEPAVFGPDVIKNPGKEFLGLGMFGPTHREPCCAWGFMWTIPSRVSASRSGAPAR